MREIDALYRNNYSKMVSALINYFGLSNIAVAEDIVQETFITALEKWHDEGQPTHEEAWLFRVCKNKALNFLQSPSSKVRAQITTHESEHERALDNVFLDHEIKDAQLRLLLTCCDSRLSPKAQVTLILKNLCGLRVPEIANALLSTEDAITRSISRSKQTLLDQGTLVVPDVAESKNRLHSVHTAIYLLFSEGYAATEGDSVIRRELCVEAMRLVKSILETDGLRNYDTYALMSLMCFHSSRFEARVGVEGELLELETQDRSKWDRELIRLGIHYLKFAHDSGASTRFILEAAIASVHAIAEKFADTNWPVIVGLYERLSELQSTPHIDLNRAVSVFHASGPDDALKVLNASRHLGWLKNNYLYYALLGKIYAAKSHGVQAINNYEKALSMCKQNAEQDFLRQKIVSLQIAMN